MTEIKKKIKKWDELLSFVFIVFFCNIPEGTDSNLSKPQRDEMRGACPWSGGSVKSSLNSRCRWMSMLEKDLLCCQFVLTYWSVFTLPLA